MPTYLVGGAVRDLMLQKKTTDKDFVVVGEDNSYFHHKNFTKVKSSFPVYINNLTKDQYALARVDRKVGKGYQGFSCFTSKSITLREDLLRRDITINALALDKSGLIIDVCGGLSDLKRRVIRHISASFCDDPLRVFRVARFRATLHPYQFKIATTTMSLLTNMAKGDDTLFLTGERILLEIRKSLVATSPSYFFSTCQQIGLSKLHFSYLTSFDNKQLSTIDKIKAEHRIYYLAYALSEDDYSLMIGSLPFTKKELKVMYALRKHYQCIIAWQKLSKSELTLLLLDLLAKAPILEMLLPVCESIYVAKHHTYPNQALEFNLLLLKVSALPYGKLIEELNITNLKQAKRDIIAHYLNLQQKY